MALVLLHLVVFSQQPYFNQALIYAQAIEPKPGPVPALRRREKTKKALVNERVKNSQYLPVI